MGAPKGNKNAVGHIPGRGVQPKPQSEYEALAAELREWAQKDDSIILADFSHLHGHDPSWINKLAEDHVVISQAYTFARSVVGARRQKLALSGQAHHSIVEKTMGMYCREYRDWVLEQKRADRPEVVGTIVVNRVPDDEKR